MAYVEEQVLERLSELEYKVQTLENDLALANENIDILENRINKLIKNEEQSNDWDVQLVNGKLKYIKGGNENED